MKNGTGQREGRWPEKESHVSCKGGEGARKGRKVKVIMCYMASVKMFMNDRIKIV